MRGGPHTLLSCDLFPAYNLLIQIIKIWNARVTAGDYKELSELRRAVLTGQRRERDRYDKPE